LVAVEDLVEDIIIADKAVRVEVDHMVVQAGLLRGAVLAGD
jgi:hypothetical protein